MNNLKKVALISGIIAILLISIAIFWHYVIYLPSIEKKANQDKVDQKMFLSRCLSDAHALYRERWDNECEYLGEITDECKDVINLDLSGYLEKHNLTLDEYAELRGVELDELGLFFNYSDWKRNCSCRLSQTTADNFNEYKGGLEDRCYKKYPVIK